VVRYRTADAPGDSWSAGVKRHTERRGDLIFTTSFSDFSSEEVSPFSDLRPLEFRVEVANPSADTFLIDPADFALRVRGKDSVLAAVDPERPIQEARRQRADETKSHKEWEAGNGAFALIGGALAIGAAVECVATSSCQSEPSEDERHREEKEHRDSEDLERAHASALAEAEARETYWSTRYLRKTTLYPGAKMEGLIGFGIRARGLPDSVTLEYRQRGGGHSDLGLYGQERDSTESQPSKAWTQTPKTIHAVDGSEPEPSKFGRNPRNPNWPGF
jgi:hypothetical protein